MKSIIFQIRTSTDVKGWILFAAVVCLFLVGPRGAAAAEEQSAVQCAHIESDAERLACYDRMAADQRQKPVPAKADTPPRSSSPAETPGAKVAETRAKPRAEPDKDSDEEEETTFSLRVVGCEQGVDKRFFFTMSNGQVWKQVNADRLYLRSCDWDVEITRDWFGYKMQRDGEKRRIRVKRVR